MYRHWLEFEKSVEEIEKKIEELRTYEATGHRQAGEKGEGAS